MTEYRGFIEGHGGTREVLVCASNLRHAFAIVRNQCGVYEFVRGVVIA